MSRYLIVIEETKTGFSAYSPDLEGCIAAGATRKEVEKRMKEAIEFHLEGLKEEKLPIPKPHCFSTYLEISA
jgi:predicted RNase H-like HicB family nuclease